MLIRSQDKRMIVNFDNICTVSAFPEKDSEDIYVEDGTGSLMVGRYSTKEKAMKVLDMIQESYTNGKVAQILSYGLRMVPTEEINEAGKIIKNAIQSSTVFQIPEDSKVEEVK